MGEDAVFHEERRAAPGGIRLHQMLTRIWRQSAPVLGVITALCIVWEGSKFLFGISDQRLPHLLDIFAVFGSRSQGGQGPLLLIQMLINAWATFRVAFGGFVLGGLLGFALALLFTQIRILERGLMPYVIGSQTVPILAIAPMVVVGLGRIGAPDWAAKMVVAAYLTFFPVTIGMLRGLRAAAPSALDLMHSYAATPLQIFVKLRFPASLPYLFTSLKIAATASVIGAIVAELPAAANEGIGVAILNASQFYNSRPPALYATVLVAGLIGVAFYGLVALAERLVVRERRAE
ncbi:MAG TPA: ABC transporter permease subunit [Roseiflexaceae bacterium]|nr:ABC transporter permease subunit [Roseiflexaceae bacterium]